MESGTVTNEQNAPTQVGEPSTDSELETLRRTNASLVKTSAKRKARVEELEVEKAAWEAERERLNSRIQEMAIEAPLKALAQESSIEPELFLQNLRELYQIGSGKDGKLELLDQESKQVVGSDGKQVELEWRSLLRLLTEPSHPRSALFRNIMIGSKASGSGPIPNGERRQPAKQITFGLR